MFCKHEINFQRNATLHPLTLLRPSDRPASKTRNTMKQRNRITYTCVIEHGKKPTRLPDGSPTTEHYRSIPAARAFVCALLLCLGCVHGLAQQNDQQQMRGLDEQVQEVKSDVLSIAAELSQLEEKLLYPSGTQVAVFIALAKEDRMRLDAVRLMIDGQLVTHYIYNAKELEALRKGGVQRIYVGNVSTGDHKLDVLVDGELEGNKDFSQTNSFTFSKEVKPKLLELTLSGPGSGNTPIAMGEW
jgi:hypothetical protein